MFIGFGDYLRVIIQYEVMLDRAPYKYLNKPGLRKILHKILFYEVSWLRKTRAPGAHDAKLYAM